MSKWNPIPVVGGAYSDESRPFAFQDCINWLPVRAERPNTREQWKLTPVPGLSVFAAFENDSTGVSDRVRGLRNVEGRLYVVCGQSLFRVNTNGTIETIQENAIPGTGRVTMTHNQETGGYSLVLTNGFGGWTYNSGTATFAEITDEGFPGFKTCDFLDQYIVGISPDGLFAFHSDLANAGEYNTLDRYTAEAAPDRLVGQIVDHGQWWLCGERTIEIYTNTGSLTNTFQRIPGSTIERGLAGTHAIAKLDNSVFLVGDDGNVYRSQGFQLVRISTHPIERELSQCDLSKAFCLVYEDRGHKILYVTCPDGKTWGYDVATQEWHRRESYERSNWRVTCLARWAGGWLGGDELTNRLQRVDWAYNTEDGNPLVCRRTTGILHGNENRIQVHAVKLVVDSGRIPGQARPLEERTYPVEIYNPLGDAFLGVEVDHTYLGRFGVPPYTFAVVAGSLPTGLSMDTSGNLTGTPTALGEFAWRVRITDSIGQVDTLDQGVDIAEGIDGGEEFEVGLPGLWLAGPVNEDGISGGSTDFYLKSQTVAGLLTATPTANPAQGAGAIERISVANGKVFMHRATTACMSADNGATWTACDNSLFTDSWARDVYWNGTNYFYGGVISADGLAWTAIPNLPSTGRVQNARDSDGLVVVQASDGVFHTTIDNGANWVTGHDFGFNYVAPIATDGTDYVAVSSSNFQFYSDDNLATASNPVAQNASSFGQFYSDGAWYSFNYASGDGISFAHGIMRATSPSVWPSSTVTANFAFIEDGVLLDLNLMAFDGMGACVAREQDGENCNIYASSDNGENWGLAGTIYGPVASIAFVGAA